MAAVLVVGKDWTAGVQKSGRRKRMGSSGKRGLKEQATQRRIDDYIKAGWRRKRGQVSMGSSEQAVKYEGW